MSSLILNGLNSAGLLLKLVDSYFKMGSGPISHGKTIS